MVRARGPSRLGVAMVTSVRPPLSSLVFRVLVRAGELTLPGVPPPVMHLLEIETSPMSMFDMLVLVLRLLVQDAGVIRMLGK